jgi:hypothetical protein
MTPRNAIGIGLIVAVIAAIGWLTATAPSRLATTREHVRLQPSVAVCQWSQPWASKAFVMTGWSQPEKWWRQPDTQVLWSNARSAKVWFRLPPALMHGSVNIGVKYLAVSATVAVLVNGEQAGALDRDANGSHAAYAFTYHLPAAPANGIVELHFAVTDSTPHLEDGRYLGVLLEAVNACPGQAAPAGT